MPVLSATALLNQGKRKNGHSFFSLLIIPKDYADCGVDISCFTRVMTNFLPVPSIENTANKLHRQGTNRVE